MASLLGGEEHVEDVRVDEAHVGVAAAEEVHGLHRRRQRRGARARGRAAAVPCKPCAEGFG